MDYDFDTPLVLRGQNASKYDNIGKYYGTEDPDIIPMWVADMDFAAAPAIRAALQVEAERGYFGYFGNPGPVSDAVAGWMKTRHGWEFDPDFIRYTHGVVAGFADVLDAFSEPGDAVVLFSPVYHAFYRQARAMGRVVIESPLEVRHGRFHMNLEALRLALTQRTRVVTLCSPHNPGGRLWSADEIVALADFCGEHGLILLSDEIHMDLTFPGARHVPTAVAAPEYMDRTVVITAASKGFNIAGAETGLLIATDPKLRAALDKTILDRESSPNRFGMAMVKAAFGDSADWSDAVQRYLAGNFALLRERLNALPGVSVMDMQATYLAWVDFTRTGIPDAELMDRFVRGARVAPSPGTQFGTGGSGHMRLNVALPRPTLIEALDRIEAAFADLQ